TILEIHESDRIALESPVEADDAMLREDIVAHQASRIRRSAKSAPSRVEDDQAAIENSTASIERTSAVAHPLVFSFLDLDAYRPLSERAQDPQIAEAQRREFFNQLHRWLRQSYGVHVFCNNEGERQRFGEIWKEYGLGNVGQASRLPDRHKDKAVSPKLLTAPFQPQSGGRPEACPTLHLGALTRGFL